MDGRPKLIKKNIRLCAVKSGQFLGEKEIIEGIPRTTSAKTNTHCILLHISIVKLKSVFNECGYLKEIFIKNTKMKNKWRDQQYNLIHMKQEENNQKQNDLNRAIEFERKRKEKLKKNVIISLQKRLEVVKKRKKQLLNSARLQNSIGIIKARKVINKVMFLQQHKRITHKTRKQTIYSKLNHKN